MRDDLISVAQAGQMASEQTSSFGRKYVIDGVIESPSGRMIGIRTVWISDDANSPPRLVTAYPN